MESCNKCGGKIVFRYQGGSPVPIHIDGGWCSSSQTSSAPKATAFQTSVSYINPNAECPICHKRVYFYQSPFGGRVFFENVGWPWTKHPCTDRREAQSGFVRTVASSIHTTFRNEFGEQLDLYKLVSLFEDGKLVKLHFRSMQGDSSFKGEISKQELRQQDISVSDINGAPSFVVRKYSNYRLLEFISARKQCIDLFRLFRPQRQATS